MNTISPEQLFEKVDRTLFSKRRIAFVGVAKNSGKTTTMNFCLQRASEQKREVLAVSIGLDGEKIDAILGTPKPPVFVFEGQWVITTRKMLEIAGATLKVNTALGIDTPLGETVIAKVVKAGEVVLTGLRHRQDLRETIESLAIEHVFIDGAYGRIMAAHGRVSDGIILSTGGVAGVDLNAVCQKTKEIVDSFHLPKARDWRLNLIENAIQQNASLLGGPLLSENILLPNPSALIGLEKANHLWTPEVHAIAIVGMLSDSVAKKLMMLPKSQTRYIIVNDPTAIQLSHALRKKLERSWEIETLYKNEVIAITVNPTSVQGHSFHIGEIEKELQEYWPTIPIFDPLAIT